MSKESVSVTFNNSQAFKNALGSLCDQNFNPEQQLSIIVRKNLQLVYFAALGYRGDTPYIAHIKFTPQSLVHFPAEEDLVKMFSCEGLMDALAAQNASNVLMVVGTGHQNIIIHAARDLFQMNLLGPLEIPLQEVNDAIFFPEDKLPTIETRLKTESLARMINKIEHGNVASNEPVTIFLSGKHTGRDIFIQVTDDVTLEMNDDYKVEVTWPFWNLFARSCALAEEYTVGLHLEEEYIYFTFHTSQQVAVTFYLKVDKMLTPAKISETDEPRLCGILNLLGDN